MEQTSGRNDNGFSRQLFSQIINTEQKSERKKSSRPKDCETTEDTENLNCIVYKIGNSKKVQREEIKPNTYENVKAKESGTAAIPSILVKRQSSRQ